MDRIACVKQLRVAHQEMN